VKIKMYTTRAKMLIASKGLITRLDSGVKGAMEKDQDSSHCLNGGVCFEEIQRNYCNVANLNKVHLRENRKRVETRDLF